MSILTENEQFVRNAVKNGNYKYETVESLTGTYTKITNPKTWVQTATATDNIIKLY